MDVSQKAAIVTGGGTGVGRETALDLARRGCSVLINYSRSRSEAEATAAEIEQLGVGAVAMLADVADDVACRAMVERALADCDVAGLAGRPATDLSGGELARFLLALKVVLQRANAVPTLVFEDVQFSGS